MPARHVCQIFARSFGLRRIEEHHRHAGKPSWLAASWKSSVFEFLVCAVSGALHVKLDGGRQRVMNASMLLLKMACISEKRKYHDGNQRGHIRPKTARVNVIVISLVILLAPKTLSALSDVRRQCNHGNALYI